MIGGATSRPVANSTGPGTPIPMAHGLPSPVLRARAENADCTRSIVGRGPASTSQSSWCEAMTAPERSMIATVNSDAPMTAA